MYHPNHSQSTKKRGKIGREKEKDFEYFFFMLMVKVSKQLLCLTNIHFDASSEERLMKERSEKEKDLYTKSIKSKESSKVIESGRWKNVKIRFVIETWTGFV